MRKNEIQEMAAAVCGLLTELGCEYHFEADNRSSKRSAYIYVRRPKYMEIRVSDHAAGRVRRHKQFDIGPHGISVDQAIADITALVRS